MEKRTCSAEGCETNRHTKYWCLKHYRRWRKSGTTDAPERPTIADRFWAKVVKTDGCWGWSGYIGPQGYGVLHIAGYGPMPAHRLSYEFRVGPIPDGYDIDYMCHRRVCTNPDHLQAVTHQKNGENLRGAPRSSTTGIRGVSFDKARNLYAVCAKTCGENHFGGRFSTLEEAEAAAIALRNRLMTNNLIDRYSAAV